MWEKYTRFNTEPLSLEGLFGTCRIVEVRDGDILKIVAQVFPEEFRVVTLRLGVPDCPDRKARVLRWLDPELFADDDDVQAKLDSTPVIAVVECFGQDEYGRELARLHNDRGCINDILSP